MSGGIVFFPWVKSLRSSNNKSPRGWWNTSRCAEGSGYWGAVLLVMPYQHCVETGCGTKRGVRWAACDASCIISLVYPFLSVHKYTYLCPPTAGEFAQLLCGSGEGMLCGRCCLGWGEFLVEAIQSLYSQRKSCVHTVYTAVSWTCSWGGVRGQWPEDILLMMWSWPLFLHLHCLLDQFAAESEAAGISIGTSKSESMERDGLRTPGGWRFIALNEGD